MKFLVKTVIILVISSVVRYSDAARIAQDNTVAEDKPSSCVCTLDYRPVCGSDQITYSNLCALGCAQSITPDLEASCEGECPCRSQYNSNTHLSQKGKSKRETNPDLCICTKIYAPVCGSNGVTYDNECMFRCAQENDADLSIANDGECGGDAST